jgi:hypothetical protein
MVADLRVLRVLVPLQSFLNQLPLWAQLSPVLLLLEPSWQ